MRIIMLAAAVALVAGCGLLRDAGRTANDIAGDLCELHFGEHPEEIPQVADGLEVEARAELGELDEVGPAELCAIHEVLKPFIEQVLSSGQEAADSLRRPGS